MTDYMKTLSNWKAYLSLLDILSEEETAILAERLVKEQFDTIQLLSCLSKTGDFMSFCWARTLKTLGSEFTRELCLLD
jgi:hypothetical protein